MIKADRCKLVLLCNRNPDDLNLDRFSGFAGYTVLYLTHICKENTENNYKDFWSKFGHLVKIWTFNQNLDFLSKFRLLVKIWTFGQNLDLVKIWTWPKFGLWALSYTL